MGEEEGCASDILELELAPFRDLHERARARESDEGGKDGGCYEIQRGRPLCINVV